MKRSVIQVTRTTTVFEYSEDDLVAALTGKQPDLLIASAPPRATIDAEIHSWGLRLRFIVETSVTDGELNYGSEGDQEART